MPTMPPWLRVKAVQYLPTVLAMAGLGFALVDFSAASSTLRSAPEPPLPASCNVGGYRFGSGGVNNQSVSTKAECCQACQSVPSCAGWTFEWDQAPFGTYCYLWASVGPVTTTGGFSGCLPNCVSGHKPFPPFSSLETASIRLFSGGGFGSLFIEPERVDGPAACAQACQLYTYPSHVHADDDVPADDDLDAHDDDSGPDNPKWCQSWTWLGPDANLWALSPGCYLSPYVVGKVDGMSCGESCQSGVRSPAPTPAPVAQKVSGKSSKAALGGSQYPSDGPDGCAAICKQKKWCVSWSYEAQDGTGSLQTTGSSCYLFDRPPLLSECKTGQCFSSPPLPRCEASGNDPGLHCGAGETFKPNPKTCGAWIIWRLFEYHTLTHQAFGYDNDWLPGKSGTPQIDHNSGYYGCGYDFSKVGSACAGGSSCFSKSSYYCEGAVCSHDTSPYNLLLSPKGLTLTAPNEEYCAWWILDPAKGESLDCEKLANAESAVKAEWDQCENPNAEEYDLTQRNCRDYVMEVMKTYCMDNTPSTTKEHPQMCQSMCWNPPTPPPPGLITARGEKEPGEAEK